MFDFRFLKNHSTHVNLKINRMKPKVDDYDRMAREFAAKEAQLAEATQQNELLKQQNQHLQW